MKTTSGYSSLVMTIIVCLGTICFGENGEKMYEPVFANFSKEVQPITFFENTRAVPNVFCPGYGDSCGGTCCGYKEIGYACCGLADSSCCSDQKHCCRPGYTCIDNMACAKITNTSVCVCNEKAEECSEGLFQWSNLVHCEAKVLTMRGTCVNCCNITCNDLAATMPNLIVVDAHDNNLCCLENCVSVITPPDGSCPSASTTWTKDAKIAIGGIFGGLSGLSTITATLFYLASKILS